MLGGRVGAQQALGLSGLGREGAQPQLEQSGVLSLWVLAQTGTSWRELKFREGCEGAISNYHLLSVSRNSDLEQKCNRNESLPISSRFHWLCHFLLCFQAALTCPGPISTSCLDQAPAL